MGLSRLWAGWRMTYIESDTTADPCLFCACVAAAAHEDRRRLVLARGGHCFVLLNAYPYTSGHLMVAPNRHVAALSELASSERDELLLLLGTAERALQHAYHPQAFNMGMNLGGAAGAGIPEHLHAHLVPRWTGDTNFMTAVAETRVLPESLDRTYERLAEAWRAVASL